MVLRYVCGGMAAIALTCGVMTVRPAYAQLRDGGLLPPEHHGMVTAVGCFLRTEDGKKYILANPTPGPVNSVPEATCSAAAGDNALDLNDAADRGMNDSLIGHWVEIYGDLEKETSTNPDNLRELEVKSFRVLPVVPPRRAEAPAPEPQPIAQSFEPASAPAPEPVATSGQAPTPLPKTAGYGPTGALIGLFALAGSLLLRSFRVAA